MESLQTALNVVAPMFLMLALGFFLRKIGLLDEHTLNRMNDFSFKVLLSLLLYYNIYTADIAKVFNQKLLLFAVGAQLAVLGALWIVVPRIEKSNARRGALIQGMFRTNFVIFGVSIATSLCGEGNVGAVSLLVAVIVPLYNAASVVVLEVYRGGKVQPLKILRGLATNPYIIAAAAGFLTLALGIRLPPIVETVVRDLTRCATPIALIVLGGLFNFSAVRGNLSGIILGTVGRLVVIPAVMVPLSIAAGFRGVELIGLMSMFIAPTAVSSFNMACAMDSDADLAGHLVVFTSLFSVGTMFFWIFALSALGYL